MASVFVLVPAFNEEKNIGKVLSDLRILRNKGVINHVLVVDDGSTDKTSVVAGEYADRVLRLKGNHGKAFAFYAGLKYYFKYSRYFEEMKFKREPKGNVLVMLDADLNGVSEQQIASLVRPLGTATKNRQTMASNFVVEMAIGRVFADVLSTSGQRAFLMGSLKPFLTKKNLRSVLVGRKMNRAGYGLENFLNYYFSKDERVLSQFEASFNFESLRLPRIAVADATFESGPLTGDRLGRSSIDVRRFTSEPGFVEMKLTERKAVADRKKLTRFLKKRH